MAIQVLGYAAQSATEKLAPFRFERRENRSNDVMIEILYCGVCHTDLHQSRNDWGFSRYPMVPGHEIIGKVIGVGKNATRFKVGDHVGVGCLVDSCRECGACKKGLEQYCENHSTPTYNGVDRHDRTPTQGGYSEKIVVSEDFVVRIPDGLDLKAAAPLLCAGITTWSPLRHWKVGKGSKVAVIGLGGLGHMALKFAKALGADVSLFTRSLSKSEDAKKLGADHIIDSTDKKQMQSVRNRFDLIIDTIPSVHDLNPYLPALALDGTIVLVGYLGPIDSFLNTIPLLIGRRSVSGSAIGGIPETQEMLDFCGEHGIVSDVEEIKIQEINKAFERMEKSDVKYRFVIDIASLKNG